MKQPPRTFKNVKKLSFVAFFILHSYNNQWRNQSFEPGW